MKDFKIGLTILLLNCLIAMQLQAGNTLTIVPYQVLPNTEFVVQLVAENTAPFVAFQVDIPVPTGFKYMEGSAVLNATRISGHALSASLLAGNILRLIGYSVGNTAFLGNSGTLVSFALKSGPVPATFALALNQPLLGDSQSNNTLTGSTNGSVTVLAPDILLSTSALNYGRVPLGSSVEQTFLITNTGNSDLTITALNFNDPQFTTTNAVNFTISSNSSQNITVKFTPVSKGTLTRQLQISSNDPDQSFTTIALNAVPFAVNELHTGNITGASLSGGKLEFTLNNMEAFTGFQFDLNLPEPLTYTVGTAQLFRTQDQSVSVNQLNAQTLRVLAFSAGNNNFTGNAGKVLSLDFLLKGVAGYYSIGISNVVIANASGENIVSDVYGGQLIVSSPDIDAPTQLNFGDMSVLASSTLLHRIYNYGQEDLAISQLMFSSPYFRSNPALPITIHPTDFIDLPVEFIKPVKGTVTATLKILSDDPDENPYTVQLSGNAFVPNYFQIQTQNFLKGESKPVEVEIENEDPFVAFQFDLSYPLGFTPDLNAIALTARKQDHVLAAIALSNTSLRILVYSPGQKVFTGKSGAVLTIPFVSETSLTYGTYNLAFSNTVISNIRSENILYASKNGILNVQLATALHPLIENADVQISPNPTKGLVHLNFIQNPTAGSCITVCDLNGKVILRSIACNREMVLNLIGNPKGLYFIKIGNESSKAFKIVLE